MGKRIDLSGQEIGCYKVLGPAKTRRTSGGAQVGYWHVVCQCGKSKELRAQKLLTRSPNTCSPNCDLHWVTASCRCGATRRIRASWLKANGSWRCRKCASLIGASMVRGKPAHNRLPGDEGSLNDLYARYAKGAAGRQLAYTISKSEFREITKQPCHYCGTKPSKAWARRKGNATPYLYNGLDRLDSALGYELQNVVACCATCNYMKQDLTFEEFIKQVALICSRHERR